MAVAYIKNSSMSERLVNGFYQVERQEVYQVEVSDGQEEATVLAAIGLPAIGSQIMFNGTPLYCIARMPVRTNDSTARNQWMVTCTLTNLTDKFETTSAGAPATDPLDVATRIDIDFVEEYRPYETCRYIKMLDETDTDAGFDPNHLVRDNIYPRPTNSAGDFVTQQQRVSVPVYTVNKYFRTWDNAWDDAVGKINDAEFTITESDADGVRFTKTFAAYSVRISNILKRNTWRSGKLYYDIGFVLIENITDEERFADEGTRAAVFTDQWKKDGTQYVAGEIAGNYHEAIVLVGEDGATVGVAGSPVPLNGYGAEAGRENPASDDTANKRYTLVYRTRRTVSFTDLGIS